LGSVYVIITRQTPGEWSVDFTKCWMRTKSHLLYIFEQAVGVILRQQVTTIRTTASPVSLFDASLNILVWCKWT